MKLAFLFAAALIATPALAQMDQNEGPPPGMPQGEGPGGPGGPGGRGGMMGPDDGQPQARADVEKRVKGRFLQMDKNGDGVLSGAELPGRMAQFMDPDGDGKVTQADMLAQALKRFDEADTNKDGVVTQEEREAMREKMRAARGQ